jgi:hypothetical protein
MGIALPRRGSEHARPRHPPTHKDQVSSPIAAEATCSAGIAADKARLRRGETHRDPRDP